MTSAKHVRCSTLRLQPIDRLHDVTDQKKAPDQQSLNHDDHHDINRACARDNVHQGADRIEGARAANRQNIADDPDRPEVAQCQPSLAGFSGLGTWLAGAPGIANRAMRLEQVGNRHKPPDHRPSR